MANCKAFSRLKSLSSWIPDRNSASCSPRISLAGQKPDPASSRFKNSDMSNKRFLHDTTHLPRPRLLP